MQPKTKKGPGVPAPKPLCIAYLANAILPYAFNVVEGNRNAVQHVLEQKGGIRAALGMDLANQPTKQAEAPEDVL